MSMPAAPMESCQSLSNRSPWGRLGSVLYTCKRLHRIRRRFNHFWSISLSRPLGLAIFWPRFASRALREHYAAASMAYAVQALTHYQTYPERPPGADLPPKKVCNLDPMAPRPRKKRQGPILRPARGKAIHTEGTLYACREAGRRTRCTS